MTTPKTKEQLQQALAQSEREIRLLQEGLRQGHRMRELWQNSLLELKAAKAQLTAQNRRLQSIYQVSSAVTDTIELDLLFARIIQVMATLLGLPDGYPLGIFLVEGERMRLAASRGETEEFRRAHNDMRLGDCLCGQAAARGEVIQARLCSADPRHTIAYRYGKPHGHLILPLQAKERVVGVFYYYLPPEQVIAPELMETMLAIGRQLGLAIDNAQLHEKTLTLTMHDPLTGLGNRRYLERALKRDLHNVARYQMALSLLLLDIDYFKRYNDTHGHLAGDELLRTMAESIRSSLRSGDLPIRYGGEELLVLLPHTPLAGAVVVAERIRTTIEQTLPVTVSIGVASICGRPCTAKALIGAADEAMYQAKEAGRNRVLTGEVPADPDPEHTTAPA